MDAFRAARLARRHFPQQVKLNTFCTGYLQAEARTLHLCIELQMQFSRDGKGDGAAIGDVFPHRKSTGAPVHYREAVIESNYKY